MGARGLPLTATSDEQTGQQTAKLVRLFPSRRLQDREQVAAVCYRVSTKGLEFLLVQTRRGRWTFPKGGAEPGLTHAQAAALEALEEAGVHGRIEQLSFARYIRKRRRARHPVRTERIVNAHLCEVLRLGPPQEANRNPTWFSALKAKRRLRQDRSPESGAELAAVVDRAVARIRRLHDASRAGADALQKVQFEPCEKVQNQAPWGRELRPGKVEHSAALVFALNAYLGKVLPMPPQHANRTGRRLRAEKRKLLMLADRPPEVSAGLTTIPADASARSKNGRRNEEMNTGVGK
jgi:8-oxo-dGTP pyrophosphatase MutT (NUDIX family)